MAVSKMKKLVLVMRKQDESNVLSAIQAHQGFQVEAVEPFQSSDQTLLQNQELSRIKQAQDILKPFVDKQSRTKRYDLTMAQLHHLEKDIQDKDVCNRVLTIDAKRQDIVKKLEQLTQKQELLKQWEKLPVLPKEQDEMKTFAVLVGVIPSKQQEDRMTKLKENDNCFTEVLYQTDMEYGVIVYAAKHDKAAVKDFLETHHFTPFEYGYAQLPPEELKTVAQQKQNYQQQLDDVNKQLATLATHYRDVQLLEDLYYNDQQKQQASQMALNGESLVAMTGFVRETDEERFKRSLYTQVPKEYMCVIEDDTPVDDKDVPTALTNHPWVEPFELLTEMYSVPTYSQIDPTPLLAPFYAVFFGMMVADIGYGLLLMAITWYMLRYKSLTKDARKQVKLFHILAYPSTLWGVIFGSFFSFELPFKLLSTSTDVIAILIVSVVFGVIQLIFGLAVNTHIHVKSKNYPTAFSDGLGWIGILTGIVMIVLANVLSLPWLNQIANYWIIANVVMIVLASIFGSQNKLLGFGSGLYKLYGASSYIGDLVSYTRLMALCVAGASIGASFNLVIGLLPPIARFSVGIVLFVVLQCLNFALALLGAYVHGIRLQFVEFFGKFYEGGGRPFRPLKPSEKHVNIKEQNMEEM